MNEPVADRSAGDSEAKPAALRPEQDRLLVSALACGATKEFAAKRAGVSIRTLSRRLRDPDFQAYYHVVRAGLVARTLSMVNAAGVSAIETLIGILNTTTRESLRVQIALRLLSLGARLRQRDEFSEESLETFDVLMKEVEGDLTPDEPVEREGGETR